jgi:magnesium transporter
MSSVQKKQSRNVGLAPGTAVFLGDKRVEQPTVSVMSYGPSSVYEGVVANPEDCRGWLGRAAVTWINVVGLHDTEMLQRVADVFSMHPLTLEDIVNTLQRPKLEDTGSSLFLVLKILRRHPETRAIAAEQVSIVLGKDYVLTFQEIDGGLFDPIRNHIRAGKGRIRQMGGDYLAYSLLDAIVDNYFVMIEDMDDDIEQLQERVLKRADAAGIRSIHAFKAEMVFLRRNLWPLRELVSALEKSESDLIGDGLSPYLRDVYEHTVQVIDSIEAIRDMLAGTMDIYMTSVSNRMNEVMKLLTAIATIFIPLTFIAGIYGMNFEIMPELKWRYGYAAVWAVMIGVAVGMAIYFRRRKWM